MLQVLDVEVQLPAAGPAEDAEGAPAALVLHTGPITLLSTDPAAGAPQRGHHALTAAEAAAHLSAAIKQRRLAARLGGGPPAGSSQDAAAAVAAVQSYLLYQQFELSIAELHAEASLPVLPGAAAAAAAAAVEGTPGSTASGGMRSSPFGAGSSTGSAGGEGGRVAGASSMFGRQWHPVLQRMSIGGSLKMHRIAEVRRPGRAKARRVRLSMLAAVCQPAGSPCLPGCRGAFALSFRVGLFLAPRC